MKSSACSTWEERAYRAPESKAVGLRQPWRIQASYPFPLYLWRLSSGTACSEDGCPASLGPLEEQNVIFILLRKEKKGIIFAPAWMPRSLISLITKRRFLGSYLVFSLA